MKSVSPFHRPNRRHSDMLMLMLARSFFWYCFFLFLFDLTDVAGREVMLQSASVSLVRELFNSRSISLVSSRFILLEFHLLVFFLRDGMRCIRSV